MNEEIIWWSSDYDLMLSLPGLGLIPGQGIVIKILQATWCSQKSKRRRLWISTKPIQTKTKIQWHSLDTCPIGIPQSSEETSASDWGLVGSAYLSQFESRLGCSAVRIHWQCRRHRRRGFDPWVRKIPRGRAWQLTAGFWPGNSQAEKPGSLQSLGSQSQTWVKWLSTHAQEHSHQAKFLM